MMEHEINIFYGSHIYEPTQTIGHCTERLEGLITQLKKNHWKVKTIPVNGDFEEIKIVVCGLTVYTCKDYLKRADFNTDGASDPMVKEALESIQKNFTDRINAV